MTGCAGKKYKTKVKVGRLEQTNLLVAEVHFFCFSKLQPGQTGACKYEVGKMERVARRVREIAAGIACAGARRPVAQGAG
jgi:hypothetical protein